MFEKTLKSGRKVKIKALSEDQIADLKDIPEIYFIGETERTIRNTNKANLAWIRCGLGGGDFRDWKPNGVAPPDNVLKQLTAEERLELVVLIQQCQIVNPKEPSNSE
ncbi:MAG: hypothetical protein Unbinned4234contig1003_28 [Prokaryotic dsDNA virus sp.]|nr:MAG: hypothetical protein Unbinned4234contig1003_28 [Prokaryotic dsDNA virus sp.]|tara:strand:+ start:892 stop:1212 length:321 start_codon:yes stop_codon:yes gene_type:complete